MNIIIVILNWLLYYLKKGKHMSKSKKEDSVPKVEVQEQKEQPAQVKLENTLLGIAKDKDDGRWYIVSAMFDIKTGTVGPVQRLGEGEMKAIVWERFQIEAVRKFIDNQ